MQLKKNKPIVGRLVLPDGTIRLYGITAAAKYLGCAAGALNQSVRDKPNRGNRLRNRAIREFPELFPPGTEPRP